MYDVNEMMKHLNEELSQSLILDGTKIVGNLAVSEDINPGFESSKTIELFFLIPLN